MLVVAAGKTWLPNFQDYRPDSLQEMAPGDSHSGVQMVVGHIRWALVLLAGAAADGIEAAPLATTSCGLDLE